MKQVVITRVSTDTFLGTLGILTVDSIALCITLEEYKHGNDHDISCIPVGQYTCIKHNTRKHPNTFKVLNVSDRAGILLHKGNSIRDTEGCIILADKFGAYGDTNLTVLDSRVAFNKFRNIIGDDEKFKLTIREIF